jgi:endonuclease/exonuclease/phosphatase family metal-dependent hydrolase
MASRLLAAMSATVASLGLLAGPLPAADAAAKPSKPVTVMTRNVYLGADINRPVVAASTAQAQGKTPQEILVALANATHVTRAIVEQTDFSVRAPLLVDEVAQTRPDLIGLQEVALWRSGPFEPGNVGVPNATTVDHDFLQILLDELAARGLDYQAVQIGNRADVEAPSFTGSPFNGTIADPKDVRLTMRDVILMRSDNALRVTGSGSTVFANNLAVSVAGATMRFDRGYNWVDVEAGSTRLRFINSHFEAFSSDLALAQASELLSDAPAAGRTNIFVCDCNSDPLNNNVKPIDQYPHRAAYDLITGPGGFTDEWLQWAPADEGWTSGLSELVNDPTAAGFDHRIDMVFGRTPAGTGQKVDRGEVTGDELADRDPETGLWPSDHAGVVLRLRGF